MTASASEPEPSLWRIRADLASAKVLLWIASAGRSGELRPEVHLYFYDRYWRLAIHYERRGKTRRADHYRTKAGNHYSLSGHDGPPFAAALAMPKPKLGIGVWAMPSREPPDEAA